MGEDIVKVEVLQIQGAPYCNKDNEEVWFEIHKRFKFDDIYVNFRRTSMFSPGGWIFLRIDGSWCCVISGFDEEVLQHLSNLEKRKTGKASRTAAGTLVVPMGDLITMATHSKISVRFHVHHPRWSLPFYKECFLTRPKSRLKNGLTFLTINQDTIAYDMLHEPHAKNRIRRMIKSNHELKLFRGMLLGKAEKVYRYSVSSKGERRQIFYWR